MPSWKKLITSGSDAQLRSLALNANTLITSSLVITNAGVRYTSSFNAATSSYIAQFGNTSLIEYTPTSSQLHLYGKISSSINNNTFDWSNSRFTNVQTIQAQTINVQQALNNYGEAAFVSRAASYDLLSASAYYSSLGDAFFSSFTPIFEQKSSLAAVRSATDSWTAVPNTSVARVNYNYNTPADPNGPIKIPNNSVVGWYSVTNRSVNVGNTSPRANYNFNAFIDPDTEEITVLTSDAITDDPTYLDYLTHTLSGSSVIVADSENPTEFLRPFRDVRYQEVTPTILKDVTNNDITPVGSNGSYTQTTWDQQTNISSKTWAPGYWFIMSGSYSTSGVSSAAVFRHTNGSALQVKFTTGTSATSRPIVPDDPGFGPDDLYTGYSKILFNEKFPAGTLGTFYEYADQSAYTAASGTPYNERDVIIVGYGGGVFEIAIAKQSFNNSGDWDPDKSNYMVYSTDAISAGAYSFDQTTFLGQVTPDDVLSAGAILNTVNGNFTTPTLPTWQPGTFIKYQLTAADTPADIQYNDVRTNNGVIIASISGSSAVEGKLHLEYDNGTPSNSATHLLPPLSLSGSIYNNLNELLQFIPRTNALSAAYTSSAGWVDNFLWIKGVPDAVSLGGAGNISTAAIALKEATSGNGRFDLSTLNEGLSNQAYIPSGSYVFDIDPTDKTTANGIIGNGTSKLYALKTEYPYLQLYNTSDKFLQLHVQNNVADPANNELEFRFYIISM